MNLEFMEVTYVNLFMISFISLGNFKKYMTQTNIDCYF